ncbi:MAG TPA: hypothetical protein VF820_00985, partial [Patescibacteria group bacterium]
DLAYLADVKRNRAAANVMQAELDNQLETPGKETPHFDEGAAEAGAMGILGGAVGQMILDIGGKKEKDAQNATNFGYVGVVNEMEKQRAKEKKAAVKAWRRNKENGSLWERRRASDRQVLEKLPGFTPLDEVNWRYGSLDGSQQSLYDTARERFLAQYGENTALGKNFRELESKRFGLFLGRDARLQALKRQIDAHANARILAEDKGKTLQERFDKASALSRQVHQAEVNKFLSHVPEGQRDRVRKHMENHYKNFLQRQQYRQLFSFKGLQTFFQNRPSFFALFRETFSGLQQRIPNIDIRSVNPPPSPRGGRGIGSLLRGFGGGGKSSVTKNVAQKFALQITWALGIILLAILVILLVNALLGDMAGGPAPHEGGSNLLFTCSDPATAKLSVDDITKNFKNNYDYMLDMTLYTDNPNQKQVALLVYNSFCELFSNPNFTQIFWGAPQQPMLGEITRPHIQPVPLSLLEHMDHSSGDWPYLKYALNHPCDGYFVKEPGSSIINDAKTKDLSNLIFDNQTYYLVLPDMDACPGGAAQAEFVIAQKMSIILANMYFHEKKDEDKNFQNSVVNIDGLLPLVGCKGTEDPKTIDGNKLYTCFADMVAEYFLYNSTIGGINASNYADGLAATLIKNCPNPEKTPKDRNKSEGWVIDAAKFNASYPQNDVSVCTAGIYPSVVVDSLKGSVTSDFAGHHLQCVGFAQAAAAGMINSKNPYPLGSTGTGFAKGYIAGYQSANPPSTLFRFVKNDGINQLQPGDIALYDWGKGGHIDVVTGVAKDNNGVIRFTTAGGSGGDCDSAPSACSPDTYFSYGTVYRGSKDVITDPHFAGWLVPVQTPTVQGQ